MQFNEFNKRLNEIGIDPKLKYLLSHMFETQKELLREMDMMTKVTLSLAESLSGQTKLFEHVEGQLKSVRRKVDGVDVHSVRNEGE